jgi:hypothetical protein
VIEMATIWPLVWLGRRIAPMLGRHRQGNPAELDKLIGQELRPVVGVNGLLTVLLSPEARAIARRKSLPLGTSLLALARKDEGKISS